MKKHKIKVHGSKIGTGGGIGRYSFRVSPLVPDSPIFQFHRYIVLDKIGEVEDVRGHVVNDNTMKERAWLARDLREKHARVWERYHSWAENQ